MHMHAHCASDVRWTGGGEAGGYPRVGRVVAEAEARAKGERIGRCIQRAIRSSRPQGGMHACTCTQHSLRMHAHRVVCAPSLCS